MFSKLDAVEKRFNELTERLYQPDAASDPALYRAITKEAAALRPIVETYHAWQTAGREIEDALLLKSDPDRAVAQMAAEELAAATARQTALQEQLRLLLVPRDPNDDRNVVVEIRAGAGGEESALFARVLYRMYGMYAEAHGFTAELMSMNETELGGCKEAVFTVSGDGAYSRLKFESGVHRVQRVPETEAGGRIHTSTATVAVLPEAEDVEVEINPNDLVIDTFRSSGAGGQHINKTSSAIRITHLPTGMVVECQDERSQFKNKDKALRVLRARLYERARQSHDSAIAADRRAQVGTGDRSERIRTYNYPQGRVTDHRIGLTLYKLDAVLNGDLDELIDALTTADRAQKLANEET